MVSLTLNKYTLGYDRCVAVTRAAGEGGHHRNDVGILFEFFIAYDKVCNSV